MTDLVHDISRCIFIDAETLPTDRADVVAYLDARIEVPGTMSKPETIEAWRIEKRPGVLHEAISKTSFEGGLGRIASIAFAVGDGKVMSATSARPASGDVPAGYDVAQEVKVLTRMWEAFERVRQETGRIPTIVGHNVIAFDIRWLWKRSIVLGVPVPDWWPLDAKPWQRDAVFDTMTAWEGHGGRISQDRLALCLGLSLKIDFDGGMVAAAWEAGEFEKIKTYNGEDVSTVREIWKRLTGYVPPVVEVAAEPVAEPTPVTAPIVAEEVSIDPKVDRDERIAQAVKTSQNGGLRGLYRPAIKPVAPAAETIEGELA